MLFVIGSVGIGTTNVKQVREKQGAKVVRHCHSARIAAPYFRSKVWYWQDLRQAPHADRTPVVRGKSCHWSRYAAGVHQDRARSARKALYRWREAQERASDLLYEKWRCIHEHEGAWNSNTGNGYYGGLQMDLGFQRAYGSEFMERWGTADRWPVWAQLQAAERAYHSGRGFGPWPSTARMCGVG